MKNQSQAKKIIHQSSSWFELNKTLAKLIKQGKAKFAGDIFEVLVKIYFETAPQYKSKIKKVYLLNEVPPELKKEINLPKTDEGIDILLVTKDNDYWAVQCKYRSDNKETLKIKGDLSTFNNLAFSVCKKISHGIVCATVNKPPRKIQLLNSVGFELFPTWLGLDQNNGELFSQIKSKAQGKILKPKKLSPRKHQSLAIKKTVNYFKNNERGKIIMPCGTGKSLTAFWIAKNLKARSILVAVPSLSLLQQTLKVWTREFMLYGVEPEWLCVCSDTSVAQEQDEYVSMTSDLGVKVDTDPKVIKTFLKKKSSNIKIVFTTYQSGIVTAIGSKGFSFDFGIMDEAHKTVGSSDKLMAHLLYQKNIKIKNRLFMTATERLFRGSSDEILSMDNPKDYGDIIYELSFKDAINANPPIISDYKIITFGITEPEIEEIVQSNKYLEVKKILKDITARELATAIGLRKAIKKLRIKNVVSFHRSIKRADNFKKQQDLISEIYPDYGSLNTFHVRGDMPTSDRSLEMMAFEKQKGLMTNARCLTEGVDLPSIDCVCFTDPKKSKVDIVQAAGRALRLSQGKKFGYILIPIFISKDEDFDQASRDQGFDDITTTVRALASADKRIADYLRVISVGKKPKGGSPVDQIFKVNKLKKINAKEFSESVKLQIWDKISKFNHLDYEEAIRLVHPIKFKNQSEYVSGYKSFALNLPPSPQYIYKNNGWKGWGEFLGTGNISAIERKQNFPNFTYAKKIVRKLSFKNIDDYQKAVSTNKKIKNFPYAPDQAYKNKGWSSWGDFLGTGRIANQNRQYKSFEEIKKFARKNKIQTQKEWGLFWKKNKRPLDVPYSPQSIFKNNGWKGWNDFLGTKKINHDRSFLSYSEASDYIKKNYNIESQKQWRKYFKQHDRPDFIPANPNGTYKNNGWKGWGEFLQTGVIATFNIKYKDYKSVKKYAQKNKIKSANEWRSIKNNLPRGFPKNPSIVYKNKGWKGWHDFLGKKK